MNQVIQRCDAARWETERCVKHPADGTLLPPPGNLFGHPPQLCVVTVRHTDDSTDPLLTKRITESSIVPMPGRYDEFQVVGLQRSSVEARSGISHQNELHSGSAEKVKGSAQLRKSVGAGEILAQNPDQGIHPRAHRGALDPAHRLGRQTGPPSELNLRDACPAAGIANGAGGVHEALVAADGDTRP